MAIIKLKLSSKVNNDSKDFRSGIMAADK